MENANKIGMPKIIHYVWVGGNPRSELMLKCIDSWRKFLPDYTIKEWNEDNYNINMNDYIRKAYQEKKWAFVSDYMRFDILYEYGGIYLDTDVELMKGIPDSILGNRAFTGMEANGYVSSGLIYGCCPQDRLVREILDSYKNDFFDENNIYTVNERVTNIMTKYGYVVENRSQIIRETMIYSDEYFCGYDKDVREIKITVNTISVHHYAASWRKKGFKSKIGIFIKEYFGVENYRKLLMIKRKLIGISGSR